MDSATCDFYNGGDEEEGQSHHCETILLESFAIFFLSFELIALISYKLLIFIVWHATNYNHFIFLLKCL